MVCNFQDLILPSFPVVTTVTLVVDCRAGWNSNFVTNPSCGGSTQVFNSYLQTVKQQNQKFYTAKVFVLYGKFQYTQPYHINKNRFGVILVKLQKLSTQYDKNILALFTIYLRSSVTNFQNFNRRSRDNSGSSRLSTCTLKCYHGHLQMMFMFSP